MNDTKHYLGAIRLRLERLYEVYPNDPILREQISDEVDWVDVQLNVADNQAALVDHRRTGRRDCIDASHQAICA
mgnify:CR=1 FL=1